MNRTAFALLLITIAGLLLYSCTDADRANYDTLGMPGHIRCYSGGLPIYEGVSTGKIQTVNKSDGWEFKDAKTGKFVRISGACIVEN